MKFLLRIPAVYLGIQSLLGAKQARKKTVDEFALPRAGERVLDIGCGPGFVIEYLPEVQYVGTDIDSHYIRYAQRTYGSRGEFHCMELNESNIGTLGQFDLVLLNGVVHHIADEQVHELFGLIRGCLTPSGRLVTLDGCYYPSMSPISRMLIRNDRGEHVREEAAYLELARKHFSRVDFSHRKDLFRVPYDALVMVCYPKQSKEG